MGRRISEAGLGNDRFVLPVGLGGTSGDDAVEAGDNIGLVTNAMRDVVNGVFSLDGSGLLPVSKLPAGLTGNTVNVQGPTTGNVGTDITFTITDYDAFTVYTVVALSGNVSRSGATITYNSGTAVGSVGFTVNGKMVGLNISGNGVNRPTIDSPIDNAGNVGQSISITGSAYGVSGPADPHTVSDWQIATSLDFDTPANVVFSSIASSTNLTTWTVTGLTANTVYYLRCRYKGTTYAYSAWSPIKTFSTAVTFGYTETSIFSADDNVYGDHFGWSVSISGDGTRCVVGAIDADYPLKDQAGKAYVFKRVDTTWFQEGNALTPSITEYMGQYGISVSMDSNGTRCIVGAYAIEDLGKVFVFKRTGTDWAEEAVLSASDESTSSGTGRLSLFGLAVTISGDGTRCVVTAPRADGNILPDVGQVYVYVRSDTTWTQEGSPILSDDKGLGKEFGQSVSISEDGTRFAIGSPWADNLYGAYGPGSSIASGRVYIFLRTGTSWAQETYLSIGGAGHWEYFGYSVSMDSTGTRCLAGSYGADPASITNAGKAYIFKRTGTTWALEATLTASDKAEGDCFGWSVSISGDGTRCVVGSIFADPSGLVQAGEAYIFVRSDTMWAQMGGPLIASVKASNDYFGAAVSMSNDGTRCLIGAYVADTETAPDGGKVFYFVT